jgi:hypothetical protein
MKKENSIHCSQAQPCYFDYLAGQSNPASEMEFEHIRHCSQCQDQIKRLEQAINGAPDSLGSQADILALHHRCLSEWIDCDVVKPFLASQAHRQLCIKTQTPITAHIAQCQACRNDLQTIVSLGLSGRQLVEAARILSNEPGNAQFTDEQAMATIGMIRNRKASGVVTRLQVDNRGQTRVQVRHAPWVQLSRRHLLVRLSAAAGILLVASLVILMTTTAGGISIQDVYNAIHSVENCRIENRDVDSNSPGQKILISRTLNMAVSLQKNETVILDFQNKRILKSTPQAGIETEPLGSESPLPINRTDFGLLPFDSITRIAPGYQWKCQDLLSQGDDWDVYDLSWTELSATGERVEKKWRGYLLKNSHLPVRIEWFEQLPGQAEEKVTEMIIEYPDTQTVLEELKDNPLYRLYKGDQFK